MARRESMRKVEGRKVIHIVSVAILVLFIWNGMGLASDDTGPSYLWHTFHGGSGEDTGASIAVDPSGNIYVAGTSKASWQGPGGANPIHGHSGNRDLVVVKLDSHGVYQWHTFYEMGIYAVDPSLATDEEGSIYVVGSTDVAWRGDGDAAPLHAHSGDYDVLVLKLNSNGVYQWHTFYGSNSWNYGYGMALDGKGNVFVTGASLTWKGDGGADPLHGYSLGEGIFVLKLSSAGAYQWHTFYGGDGYDYGQGIAVDGNGNIYVAGESSKAWQGDGGKEPLHAFGGEFDIVVLKLNDKGGYEWHTFYGSGNNSEGGKGIAVDGEGNVYVTGEASSTWKGDGDKDPIHPRGDGGSEIFVLKLNGGGGYQWHTFHGGINREWTGYSGIAVDGSRNVFIAGSSNGIWPFDGGIEPLHPYTGGFDIFLMSLDTHGAYRWHTLYGSGGDDYGWGMTLDKYRNIYVTGGSKAAWQGDGGANPLNAHSGDYDLVVLKMSGVRMTPSQGTVGTEITVTGSGFGTKKGKVLLDKTALKILEWTDQSIRCSIPKALSEGAYSLTIQPSKADPIVLSDAFTSVGPEIGRVSPSSGSTNDEITISGRFFGTKKGKVTLGDKNCRVTRWVMTDLVTGEGEIKAVVPRGLDSGNHGLNVINGVGSDSTDFTIN